MAKKNNSGTKITIKGDVKAGRDVIMGDQFNYGLRDERIAQITSVGEFRKALEEIQGQIANLKEQPNLTSVQTLMVETAQKQIVQATEETKKENPGGSTIKKTLEDAKEAFDAVKGTLAAAVGLGTTLASIIAIAIKLFGG